MPEVIPGTNQRPLPYVEHLQCRRTDEIALAVIHCTELPDLEKAREWGERIIHKDTRTGNSGHFYIDRDGSIEQWVPINRVAHHVRQHNAESIGIELVNKGRFPNWFHSSNQHMDEPYPGVQIEALASLLNKLCGQLPTLLRIAGHAEIDTGLVPAQDRPDVMIRRKLDPGPHFPWRELLSVIQLERNGEEQKGAR